MNLIQTRHTVKLLLLTMGLAACQVAAAGRISVKSADPPEGFQGTALDVTITGSGFGPDAEAYFLLTTTEDPGDIVVDDTVYVRSSKLIAKIRILDEESEGDFDDYDIEVLSGGRRGKGTTLFRVLKSDPPSEEDLAFRWLPSIDYGDDTAAAEDVARGPCTTDGAHPQWGNYFCPHRIWPDPIRFDFSGIPRTQIKKNGNAALCAAMDDITMVANRMYTVAWEDGPCRDPGSGCEVYALHWFGSDEFQDVEALVAAASGVGSPAVDFVKMKVIMRAFMSDHHDANPLANDLDLSMDMAVVQFIRKGTNRDAAVCVYDFSGAGKPLVLETNTLGTHSAPVSRRKGE